MNRSSVKDLDMPSDLFYIINFIGALIISICGILLNLILIIIVILHRQCHTVSNLLACNTSIGILAYFSLTIFACLYGFREQWAWNSPLCVFRAYLYVSVIAGICYSFSIQSFSRLFFTIYYRKKSLLTWRIHYLMIFVNWFISFLIPLVPLYIDGSLGLEKESRDCVLRSNLFPSAIFCVMFVTIVLLSMTIIIYGRIYQHAHRSTIRILRSTSYMHNRMSRLNIKRELKLMEQLLLHTICAACGGTIFLFNVLWQAFSDIPLPKTIFLISYNLMTIGISLITIAHLLWNKNVRKLACQYWPRCC